MKRFATFALGLAAILALTLSMSGVSFAAHRYHHYRAHHPYAYAAPAYRAYAGPTYGRYYGRRGWFNRARTNAERCSLSPGSLNYEPCFNRP